MTGRVGAEMHCLIGRVGEKEEGRCCLGWNFVAWAEWWTWGRCAGILSALSGLHES